MARKPARRPQASKKASARRAKAAGSRSPHSRLGLVASGAVAAVVLVVGAMLAFSPDPVPPAPATVGIAKPPPPAGTPAGAPARSAALVTRAAPEPQVAAVPPRPKPAWERNAMPASVAPGQPMIAIVIDDMGVDRARSDKAMELPAPLTLAYLAYARDLAAQAGAARAAGHELLVHVPMEPSGAGADPGPNALLTALGPAELARRIDWNLTQFDRFVGINNHMGSRATEDAALMDTVMTRLAARGLLFLDSRTSGATVAQSAAARHGIPALRRDVFLDHDPSPIAVRTALLEVEEVARRQGHAIAIGHPKDATIDALREWLPDARARGFALVPVSAIARRANEPVTR
jgi:polysaccharide deacetylase 2 family uncharacterized protein YibQ